MFIFRKILYTTSFSWVILATHLQGNQYLMIFHNQYNVMVLHFSNKFKSNYIFCAYYFQLWAFLAINCYGFWCMMPSCGRFFHSFLKQFFIFQFLSNICGFSKPINRSLFQNISVKNSFQRKIRKYSNSTLFQLPKETTTSELSVETH